MRQLLDKSDQHFAPKKVYGKQSLEDDEDDEDYDPNAIKIALPRDIRIITARDSTASCPASSRYSSTSGVPTSSACW